MVSFVLRRLGVLLLVASLVALNGCAASQDSLEPIRIGVIAPFSGEFIENGEATRQSVELAQREINAKGGLLVGGARRQVTLVYGDDQDSPEAAVNIAKSLINRDKVVALVGMPFSRIAIPVSNIAEQAGIPMISSTSTNPETTAGKRYVFRATFTDPFQGSIMARFARRDLKVTRAAVLFDQASAYNRGIAEIFREVFTAEGGTVVAYETYVTGDLDFREALRRIKASGAETLFLPNYYTEVPLQAAQARELGISVPLLGADGWDVQQAAPLPEFSGSYISQSWHPDIANEKARAFIATYQATYQKDNVGVVPYDINANTYDAMGLLFNAIERANSTNPEAIRDQLAATSGYQGVTGTISYDGGDPIKSAVIVQILDGKDLFYRSVDP